MNKWNEAELIALDLSETASGNNKNKYETEDPVLIAQLGGRSAAGKEGKLIPTFTVSADDTEGESETSLS